MEKPSKPPHPLPRRLRRLQDAMELSVADAAKLFRVPIRTYSGHLYNEHMPRGGGMAHFERILSFHERKLNLPPIE